jgi:hypothetical protein
MSNVMGRTKIDDIDDMSGLINAPVQPATSPENPEGDKPRHTRSAKYSDSELKQLEKIMVALGTDQVTKALKWCFKRAWEVDGEKIEKLYEIKNNAGSLDQDLQVK